MKFTVHILLIFFSNCIFGYSIDIDKPDKINFADSLFIKAQTKLGERDFINAHSLLDKSLNLYSSLNDDKNIALVLSERGRVYFHQERYDLALSSFQESEEYYKSLNLKKELAKSYNSIGATYYYLGDNLLALEHYKKAVRIQNEFPSDPFTAAINQNIGALYIELNNYDKALLYFNSSLNTNRKNNSNSLIALNLNSIGEAYSQKAEYKKALKYFGEALYIAEKIKDKQRALEVIFNIGVLYSHQQEQLKALEYYNQSLILAQELNNNRYKANAFTYLGKTQELLNKYNSSIRNCKLGYAIANDLNAIDIKVDACECLYKVYKNKGYNKKALLYHEKYIAYQDSLNVEEASKEIINMEFENRALIDSISYVNKQKEIELTHLTQINKQKNQRNIILGSTGLLIIFAGGLWGRLRYVKKSKKIIQLEKSRSETLLLNILPYEIAQELKANGFVVAKDFDLVSILFTDFKSFTEVSEKLSPQELVEEINTCFKEFDKIIDKYSLEKIKTIGDAYMAAGGLPDPDNNSIKNILLAALEMQVFISKRKTENYAVDKPAFEMRLGIHAGPIVAGIVGIKKFQYDVWGDTVNTASRIESNGEVGEVNVSEVIYKLMKDDSDFTFKYRGLINAKGKGDMKMYFLKNK